MKQQKKGNKTIVVPILNNEYKVIVCYGEKVYIQKMARKWGHGNINLGGQHRGYTFTDPELHPFIAIKRFPKNPEEFGTLAHEAVHAVGNIYAKVGENFEAGEIFGHSVGAIVRGVLEK